MQKQHKYLLIGNGKLASHLSAYFSGLGIDFLRWSRSDNILLQRLISQNIKILLAISDDAIEPFIMDNLKGATNKTIIHFSGSLSLEGIESAHPLMTFSNDLYSLAFYKTIPFITEKGKKSFKELFPELANPSFAINSGDKPLYHAWCSIAGNFTTILWQNFEERLQTKFDIPKEAMLPYLQKIMQNIVKSEQPLTGPFARKDFSTIENHKIALKDDPFLNIYQDFYSLYFNKNLKNEADHENS